MNEKQFETVKVNTVFMKLAIPNLFSMVFSSIYMMADGVFVGRYIGSSALAAVNLVMPILMIIFALGDMIAVGSSVKISIALGEKHEDKARRLFTASLCSIGTISIVLMILGSIFAKSIIFTIVKDTQLAMLAYQYARVLILALPFIMPMFALDNYLRNCGKAKFSMVMNIGVSVFNIFLDWLFIAKMGRGIEYAAIATGLSMGIGTIVALTPFVFKKVTLYFTAPKISFRDFHGIVYNGSSEFFNNIAGSVMATIVNMLLLRMGGTNAVAAYGIVMYIDTFLIAMLYGILDSVQPAVSYNLGAKNEKRINSFFKISCSTASAISVICMSIMLFFSTQLASLFIRDSTPEIINITQNAIILFAPSYLFTWFNMVSSSFLTSYDKPKESLIIMGFRSIIFPLITLVIAPQIWDINGIFVTPTIASGLTFLVAIFIWNKAKKQPFK